MRRRSDHGFTLIELLVTVAIIGLISAIAMMSYLSAITRARQKATMNDMRQIATAWEARATDLQTYVVSGAAFTFPTAAVDPLALVDALEPTYIKKLPLYDGWRRPYEYATTPAGQAATYGIRSAGRDGLMENGYADGPTTNPDCDIVFSEGRFIAYPEGVQTK